MRAVVLKWVHAGRGDVSVGGEVERGIEFFAEHASGLVCGVVKELANRPGAVIRGSDLPAGFRGDHSDPQLRGRIHLLEVPGKRLG